MSNYARILKTQSVRCPVCGEPFRTFKNRVCCSMRCEKALAKGEGYIVCRVCKKWFIGGSDAKCCSANCQAVFQRRINHTNLKDKRSESGEIYADRTPTEATALVLAQYVVFDKLTFEQAAKKVGWKIDNNFTKLFEPVQVMYETWLKTFATQPRRCR